MEKIVNFELKPHALSQPGFTLIELLTTIAIIAILAGLSLSGLSIARNKASDVHCKNNVRQLGIAARMYADDNQERFPAVEIPDLTTNGATVKNYEIRLILQRPAGSDAIFWCKKDRNFDFKKGGSSYEWNTFWNRKLIDKGAGNNRSPLIEPLLSDSEPRHKGGKNAVFVDGRVGKR